MRAPVAQRSGQPITKNKEIPTSRSVPPVHWPGQQNATNNRPPSGAPLGQHRSVAAHAVQQPPTPAKKKPSSAMQRATMPQHGAARVAVAQPAVIQGWHCR
jgi:hypothetical protein